MGAGDRGSLRLISSSSLPYGELGAEVRLILAPLLLLSLVLPVSGMVYSSLSSLQWEVFVHK